MGLDSHVYSVKLSDVIDDFSFKGSEKTLSLVEFFYWRKNFGIPNAMKRIFIRKGGDANINQFNCDYVRLELSDIEFLKNDTDWLDECYSQNCEETIFMDGSDREFFCKAEAFLKQNTHALYFLSWY